MKYVIVACVALLLICGCEKETHAIKSESYSLVGLDSAKLSFKKKEDALSGNFTYPYLLVFLSTWCESCLAQAQHIANLDDEFKGQIKIYGIFVDKDENIEDLRAFIKDSRTNFTWFYKGDIPRLVDSYHIKAFPFMLLYDKDGNLIQSYDGLTPEEMIAFNIKKILESTKE